MVAWILKKILGSKNQRELRRLMPIVRRVNELDEQFKSLSDDELRAKTASWKEEISRIPDLPQQWKRLDEILPEAFAVVKNAARRLKDRHQSFTVCDQPMTWDMVHFDVQLVGGMVLHRGRISEMATGEGKTLVATLPLYLNALAGRGAHLVTVNNYLARRDSQWMGHVFKYLRDNMVFSLEQRVQREHAYAIIDEVDSILIDEARTPLIISGPVGNDNDDKYAQFNRQVAELVRKQTGVVNTLLAEAERLLEDDKTRQDGALKLYQAQLGMPKNKRLLKMLNETGIKQMVQRMELDAIADRKLPMKQQRMRDLEETLYFVLDEKGHSVHLTDRGAEAMSPNDPGLFLVPDISEEIHRIDRDPELTPHERIELRREVESDYAIKSEKLHIIHKLLQAHVLYEKEVDYLVQDGQVVIVDEFTGRVMTGRRWSDGLHQAVEAKEGVQVKGETQTFATIPIQNYFRMYEKLAGMTGTAETEENEFYQIYGLDVAVIPTNRPMIREDRHDLV